MYDNYFFLKRLAIEFDSFLKGSKILEIYSQSKNELIIQLQKNDEIIFLAFTFNTLPPLFFIKQTFSKAHKNVFSFFKDVWGKDILSVSCDNYERNIRIKLNDNEICICYRSKLTNVYLINSEGIIISSFKKNEKVKGKLFNDEFLNKDFDLSIFEDNDKFTLLMEQFIKKEKNYYHSILSSSLIIEILHRKRQESEKPYLTIYNELSDQFLKDDLYIYDNFDISIGKLISKKENSTAETDFISGIRTAYYEKLKLLGLKSIKLSIGKVIDDKLNKIRSKLANLKSDIVLEDKSEIYRLYGNILLQNSNQIVKGQTEFIHKDIENDITYTIKLNPSKNVFDNSSIYFEKAKNERTRIIVTENLITNLEKSFADLEALKEIVRQSSNMHELKNIKEQLKSSKGKQKKQKKEIDYSKAFKQFPLHGGYTLFVGKDSKSNDILTTKFAKKDDIWLHVKGAMGAHCVIRKNKGAAIPRETIKEAAEIAAFYSNAKTSEYVPVSFTEKKYVQKKKEMAGGAVILLREKVLIVKPKIPQKENKISL